LRSELGLKTPPANVLYLLITLTRYGQTKLKIIDELKQMSLNTNQLATALEISYKTAKWHLEALEKDKIVISSVDSLGAKTYVLSKTMQMYYEFFEKLWKQANEKQGRIIDDNRLELCKFN
jgi:predicted ArsR family transcriptional regulator